MQTAAVVCTVALVVLSPPPRVCLPRAQIFLAAGSEHDAARGAGRCAAPLQKIIDGEATLEEAQLELARQRHTAGLQTMVDRGDAATLEEAQLMLSRQGHAALMQNMVDRGEAATLEEASKLTGVRMRAVTLQKMVDRGEAATLEEAGKLTGVRARAATLQNMVDRGEAATLEEASTLTGKRMRAVTLQNMVDRGEAATLEEAQLVLSRQGRAAALQNMVDRGEAATLEAAQQVLSRRAQLATAQRIVDRGEAASLDEAQQLLARRRREAFEAKYSFEDIYKISSASGIKTAKKRGFRTRYPGVRWQKKQDKKTGKPLDEGTGSFPESSRGFWRVAFQYKGKPISVGSGYGDEEAAARAHDDYVRKHKLQRRLHFPRAGEGGGVGAEA